jgi:hypothetical protein
MGHNEIVQKRGILLPHFVFFIDLLFEIDRLIALCNDPSQILSISFMKDVAV